MISKIHFKNERKNSSWSYNSLIAIVFAMVQLRVLGKDFWFLNGQK